MIKSRIYQHYFPIKDKYFFYSIPEKNKLIIMRWIRVFLIEAKYREKNLARKGYRNIRSFDLDKLKHETEPLCNKIKDLKALSESELALLNIILYRHKYNVIISCFAFPMMSEEYVKINFTDS